MHRLSDIGEEIWVISRPLNLPVSVTKGNISSLLTPQESRAWKVPPLQISAPISHGSSGGAVVDAKMHVIGVVSCFMKDGQNVNFAGLLISTNLFQTP